MSPTCRRVSDFVSDFGFGFGFDFDFDSGLCFNAQLNCVAPLLSMEAELLARPNENWSQKTNGGWFMPGKPCDLMIRANVVRLWLQSEVDKKNGNKGSTMQQISNSAGPCLTTCKVTPILMCRALCLYS
jgi:hypothetical protein